MKRKSIIPAGLIVAALVVIYYRYDPGLFNWFLYCPFHRFSGFDCPGCGSQRAVHALLHGEVLTAMDHNALFVLAIPFALVYGLHRLNNKNSWRLQDRPKILAAILCLVAGFWILRNLPVYPLTYLAS